MIPPGRGGNDERRALVRKLLEQRGIARGGAAAIARRSPGPIPLSFPQQRLWFLHQLDPRTSAYNLTAALALTGDLDVAALRRALGAVVARHDALRMGFATVDGEARVALHERLAVDLPVVEVGAGEVEAHLRFQAHAPFELSRPPLFRAQLLRLSPREHVLALTAHHIVFDGWSIGLFIRELAACYRGVAPPVSPEPLGGEDGPPAIGYADFAAWQRSRDDAGAFDADLSYWTTQLADLPLLDLPADRPRPAVSSFAGASRTFSIAPDLMSRVAGLARSGNATPFMALTSALAVVLGRFSNQTDVAIGSPIAGRSAPELEGLIGLFANTLVLRADLSGAPTFRELLARVRHMTLDAYAHQDVPFEYLVERLRPERRLSAQPLFQVALAMQHEGIGALTLPGLDVRVIDVPSNASKFDLTIALTEERGGLSGSAEYSTDLFDAATIERLLDSYRTVLDAVVTTPDAPMDRLPLIPPPHRSAVLNIWDSQFAQGFSPALLLHEAFEQQAARRPDAVALSFGDEAVTYRELNARANRLAAFLRGQGVGVEDRVGLYLDRTPAIVVAILAILKAGAAYVPVDPVNPADRVGLILEDAGVRLLLSESALTSRLPPLSMPVVLLDTIPDAIRREPDENPGVAAPPDALAYVIYTSGSTGRPKGVLIQHDHVRRLFTSTNHWFGFDERDVWTLFHSYGFDFSVWEIWGALLFGGRLVVVPYLISRSPAEFRALLESERVTVLNQTPSAFAQLIDADAHAAGALALRWVIFGGEALDLETLRPWFTKHGDASPRLVNMYGITETTVHVTYRPILQADLDARAGSVIGRPIPDLRLLVLDRHLEPVPFGVAGELCVGGAGIARGYLNRPDLTADKFVPDPFVNGGRLYRSGDLARLSASGELTYLGRIDHQVKIRGFRIEIGEIASALSAHADVADAAVLALDRDTAAGGDRRLVAYVAPRGGAVLATAALREHLGARLPDYMIPSAFVVLERLPLTPHGKVDRRALPDAVPDQSEAAAYEAPISPAEQVLASVWGEVLRVDRVGRHDNFFELGGDSIRSIRVLALARERGVAVSLQDLFQHQTIAAIAAALGDAVPPDGRRHVPPFSLIGDHDRGAVEARFGDAAADAYPLTRLQEGMLFHGAFSDSSTIYHNVSSFHLRIAFDGAALAAAIGRLMDRHEILRTSLHPSGFSQPLQIVHRTVAAPLVVDDWRQYPDDERRHRFDAWFANERTRRFDWSESPLFRIHVHRLTDSELQITLTEHHAVLDGWSVATLLSELMADYLGAIGVAPAAALAAPSARFVDHVAGEIEALSSAQAREFWDARLADTIAPPLPVLAPQRRPGGVVIHEAAVPPDVVSALDALARSANVPLRTPLLAAHAKVASMLLGQPDLVTGLVVNTRPETADGERSLGLFLNTMPLRVRVSGGSWRRLCETLFDEERAILPHRRYPLAELQRSRGGAPIFRTAFNYVHFHVYDAVARLHGLELLGQRGAAETDLPLAASFSRDVTSGAVRLSLECADTGIDAAALARIAGYYLRALAAIAADPDAPHNAFSPLGEDENLRLRRISHGARAALGPSALARVSSQAASRPDAIAIVAGDRRVSFAELDAHSTVLARRLRARGVGPESRVALKSAATPGLIAGMLAVWKAGGAFLPLDPGDPEARIAFMLEDAAPVLVLTDPDLNTSSPGVGTANGAWPAPDPDAPAYVIYTSGSTGRPKGVVATHRGLANLLDAQIPRFGLTPESRVLQFAALGFDASISEIFTTLCAGGTLVLAPRDELRVPDRLTAILREHAVTTVTLPPTMLAVINEKAVPDLQTIVSAGEACRAGLVTRWSPGRRFLNAYGPTETTVCATMSGTLDASDATGFAAPIGTPLGNLDAWVLDRSLAPVPCGVAGELFIGGESLTRGYLGRPDLTAERFIPHPFGEAGARLYRTGDLARWREDGRLEYVGRNDSQVKIRGVRVELGELEAILQRHPDVRQAAVVVTDDGDGQTRLTAYVEHGGRAPGADELREHLASAVSSRVLPSSIVVLDRLPLTASGKLDRRALPAPARPALDVTFAAPAGPIETALAAIWAGVLKIDRAGVHDNFFALGGDSILSLQVVSRARAAGIHITPQQVFEHQTIAALARVAGAAGGLAVADDAGGETALSPIQRWFFDLDIPSPAHWNQALLLEVAGGVDREALARACATVFAHHEAFRQRFRREGDRWHQAAAADSTAIALERIDLASIDTAARAARIREHSDAAQQSLDLADGPLARVVHYDCGRSDAGRLLLVAHHLIVDGVSWRILLDDLQSAYAQAHDGAAWPQLPAATASFASWTARMSSAAEIERLGVHAHFWTTQSRLIASARTFGEAAASDALNTEGDASTFEAWLDEDVTEALLRAVPNGLGASPQEAMIAAAAHALSESASSAAIGVAIESHGRDAALDLSRTVGWFTAMYPVALEVSSSDAPDVALRRIRQQLRAVPDHGASYGWLRDYSTDASLRETLSVAPEISFNYLGRLDAAIASGSPFSAARETLGPMRDPSAIRPHLLDIVASVEGGRLRIAWLYPERLIARARVETLSAGTMARLKAIVAKAVATKDEQAIEDAYALTPMQHGMLFHALLAPSSGVYVQQVSARLRGALDPVKFHAAWDALVARHAVLRSAFDWETVGEPCQNVYRTATLPWRDEDWSRIGTGEQTARVNLLLADDRARGFDLARPPLMRVCLIRLAADRWQLIWTHHHLILDGWSVPLLLRDLFDAYRSLCDGSAPNFETRPAFREHVAWVGAQNPEIARAFWTERFAGLERPPSIASSVVAGADALAGSMHHAMRRLTEEETAAISAFARRQELTLNTVVQAAWALVVAAHSNARDVLYGVTVGGRPAAVTGSDRMVGICINTLPVRATVDAGTRLSPWLHALQRDLARLRDFEHTPLIDALGCSALGRRPGALESLFVFENYPLDAAVEHSVPGLAIEEADAHEQTDFGLTVVAVPGREMLLKIDADATKFERGDTERLLAAFHDVLTRMPAYADRALGALMDSGSGAAAPSSRRAWPDQRLVHELIDAQAERSPSAAAIADGSRTMTFAELRQATDDVAAMLAAKGVTADECVGVALPRSIELIVALIGVMKAGAAYMPLDPAQPEARRAALIDGAGARVVIRSGDRWPARATAPRRSVSPDGLAYILYTSGSTGAPKGVMVTHRGLANYVRWACEAYAAGDGRGALLHSPIGFDLTITSLFPPLVSGRTVRLVAEEEGLDGLAASLTNGADYSLIKITPAHLDALRELAPDLRGSARAFVIGGEALTHEQLAHWRVHAPGTRLINEYGPTETVVGCAVYDATGDTDGRGPVPIGTAIANTRLYVLDRALNRAPAGVIGELYIGGDGVARGYRGRPDLTAAVFVPDPFAPAPGARMYRSGDLARVRADGVLEFLGRADDQLKIRGYRIEPGEIETVLLSHPSVREAAVVAQQIPGRSERQLAAFVTVGPPADAAVLRAWLRERLPAYLVPASITYVDRLPLTVNGKVDRARLAQAEMAAAPGGVIDPPRGAAEELLAAIWHDVLGLETIDREDNFFDLGGHSLLATRIVSRARLAFGDHVALRDIFEAPTIAGLAVRALRRQPIAAADPIEPAPPGEPPVLSFAQQRLWVLDQLEPSSTAYLVPAALRIEGPLDVDAFRRALAATVARHEVLRTGVRASDGSPAAEVAGACETPLTIVDLRRHSNADQQTAIADAIAQDARTPFDLSRPPLMRATLLGISDTEHVLLLTLHHIVSDARSTELLVQELASSYAGAATPAPLRVQYRDVARWQRHRLDGHALDLAIDRARARLDGVPVLELPADRRRPRVASTRGASLTVALPAEAAAALVSRARGQQATAFMAFLAAFEILLARLSGQRDFAVGTPVSGRNRPETERLIGLFVNTLVLRSDVGRSSSFVELLHAVRATTLDAQAAQDLPFERLVDALAPERAPGHTPLFQVMFTLQHAAALPQVPGLRVTPVPLATASSKFDVSLSVNETADGWQATFEYRTDLFDEGTIAAMAARYARIVDAAAKHPDLDVFALPWMSDDERNAEIQTWNATQRAERDDVLVPEAIARQSALTPDAVALMAGAESLNYRELWRRVTDRAAALRRDGIGPESIVPLAMDRSIDLVVSMLAILDAGAAYAPLDPAAPPERRQAMLERLAARRSSGTALEESIAYVIFTSGSTGEPKGVAITHRALANHMRWMQRVFPLGPGDRVLQKTPAVFDASVWEFFAPLMAGATLVVAPPGAHQDPETLIDLVRQHEITTLQLVPSMLRLMIEVERFETCVSLRRVFAGGEALTADLRDRFFDVSAAELINLYGPTEVTIDSVVWTCRRDEAGDAVPIGFPVDNTTAYVLDERLEPVPHGVPGELYLGGASVARGYLGQPALTAERFLPDPFAREAGAVFYRTGDRVRRRADGALEYLGRIDRQVKLRGFRIEPGEIERALESHDGVRQAVVAVHETPASRRLVAYLVCRDGMSLDEEALRNFLASRLPDYMIPSAFVALERLPLLPSGKLDRRALPDPPEPRAVREDDRPRSGVERGLAAIWREVLGLGSVGIRDNFFALGGDSILALQVVARARKAGLVVSPAQMFLHQTIEALALEAAETSAGRIEDQGDDGGPIPLTPVQRWFFDLPLERRHHWNQSTLLQTPPDLDSAALRAAAHALVARHDALRLRFVADGESWRQEYHTPGEIFETIDLSHENRPAEALDRAIERIQHSLDLGTPPLLKIAWFDFGGRPGRLLIVAHHLIIDGVSWRILLDDLRDSYEGKRAAHSTRPTTFRAWARDLNALASSGALDQEIDFWRAQLEPSPSLPIDGLAGDANLEADARHVDLELPGDVTAALLHDVPSAARSQILDVLLAALAGAFAAWTGDRILSLELEAHGRDALDLDVSQTIGWFTSLFPLRLDTRHATAVDQQLRAVRDQLRAVPRKGAGFGMLRYGGPDDAVRSAFAAASAPQVSFNYLGQWPMAAAGDGDGFGSAPEGSGQMRSPGSPRTHLIEIVAGVVDRRLRVRWTYGERLHRRETIEALASGYRRAVESIVDHCLGAGRDSYTPSDFSAADLDQSELDKLLSKLRGS